MKKIIIFLLMIILIPNYIFASQYNNGYNMANSMMSGSNNKSNYHLYVNEILKKCSRISGDVHHMGDARLPLEVCQFTAGFRDKIYGTTTNVAESCVRSATPSDIVRPSNISLSSVLSCLHNSTAMSLLCPAKTFYGNEVNTSIVYQAPSNTYPNGTYIYVNSMQNGQSCSQNGIYSCKLAVECEFNGVGLEWNKKTESCACVTPEVIGTCSGTPPLGTGHCRCGRWVSWEVYRTTHEC